MRCELEASGPGRADLIMPAGRTGRKHSKKESSQTGKTKISVKLSQNLLFHKVNFQNFSVASPSNLN